MAEGMLHQLKENREALREGRPLPHNLGEGRFKLRVTATASVSREELERLVLGALERLGARNVSGTSADWWE
jgi:hypothetical protein